VSEGDRCGPDFHYDVVVQVNSTNSTLTVAAAAAPDNAEQSWTNVVVVDANCTSADVNMSSLSWLIGRNSLQLSVRAENIEGPATGPLQSVTVINDAGMSLSLSMWKRIQTATDEHCFV